MARALTAVRPKPRYIQVKHLASGHVAYFFVVPAWARKRGCRVESKALGSDREAAFHYATTVLLPQFDAWRTGDEAVSARQRGAAGAPGYVYFIVTATAVKIGFSKNPFSRTSAMKTGISERIDILCAVAGSKADEARVHALLRHRRRKGEWFSRAEDVLAVVASAAVGRLPVRITKAEAH